MSGKLKLYRRHESNIWRDLRLKATHLASYEYISRADNVTEQSNVGRSLSLRMDLKHPKKVYKRKTLYGVAFREKQIFKKFYGNLKERKFRKVVSSIFSKRGEARDIEIVNTFERRLDVILFRSNFVVSLEMAHQWIRQGYVLVNNKKVLNLGTVLGFGDVVSFVPHKLIDVELNLLYKMKSETFLPPFLQYMECNYNTFEILYFNRIEEDQLLVDMERMKLLYSNL